MQFFIVFIIYLLAYLDECLRIKAAFSKCSKFWVSGTGTSSLRTDIFSAADRYDGHSELLRSIYTNDFEYITFFNPLSFIIDWSMLTSRILPWLVFMFVGNVVDNRCPLRLFQYTIIFTWWSCPVTMVSNRLNPRSNLITADLFWCCFKFLRDTLVKYKSRSGSCKYERNENLNIYRNALT